MRETETKATAFASPMRLERVLKYLWLEPGGLRWFHKSSRMSPNKILPTPLPKWDPWAHRWALAAQLGAAPGVTASTLNPAIYYQPTPGAR